MAQSVTIQAGMRVLLQRQSGEVAVGAVTRVAGPTQEGQRDLELYVQWPGEQPEVLILSCGYEELAPAEPADGRYPVGSE